jgi:hypothetical protein
VYGVNTSLCQVKWSPHTENNTYDAGTIAHVVDYIVLCDKVLWHFKFYKL